MNLGIGLGGVVGGLIATTADPHSFTVLYLLDAATFLAFVVVLGFVREPRPGPHCRTARPGRATGRCSGTARSSRCSG